ncbi:putative ABC-type xenobiotic transporter [Helianthus annuus]|nr:putative ABC-type xenobiotic transporter [Helianthus annuus]KAJ0793687.1 putative ABC-type xenobiotic transporter [Helianthus annuus]KAJ0958270.1 putative ABC-type xenobiotic transporter [Helianthus annuus]
MAFAITFFHVQLPNHAKSCLFPVVKSREWMARSFLRKIEMMLLDEVTGVLDAEPEKCIQGALERVCSGKTTIFVAQKLSTIRKAHVMAMIDDGKVAEQGSHSHLLKKVRNYFAKKLQLQTFSHREAANWGLGSSSKHQTDG